MTNKDDHLSDIPPFDRQFFRSERIASRIGNGAIVGAGSVVTQDIPDYEIHVGIPNRRVAVRFEGEDRQRHMEMLAAPATEGRYCPPKMV